MTLPKESVDSGCSIPRQVNVKVNRWRSRVGGMVWVRGGWGVRSAGDRLSSRSEWARTRSGTVICVGGVTEMVSIGLQI